MSYLVSYHAQSGRRQAVLRSLIGARSSRAKACAQTSARRRWADATWQGASASDSLSGIA